MPNYNVQNDMAKTLKDLDDRLRNLENPAPKIQQTRIETLEATASGTYVDLATPGPSLAVQIGSSGSALITIQSYCGVNGLAGLQAGAFIGVGIDGALPTGNLDRLIYYAVSAVAAIGLAGTPSGSAVITGLSQGPHTFKMMYYTASGGTVSFQKRQLQVTPL